jgi:putative tryptophan/tyrosine transport system permease protein
MTLWVGALVLGLAFSGMALGVYLTFRVLAFPDLTVDGSLPLGAAVSAALIVNNDWPAWATLPIALSAGALAGAATALLHTKFQINGLLAGILVSLGLWTVNLHVMGERANLPLLGTATVLTPLRPLLGEPATALHVSPADLGGLLVFGALTVLAVLLANWLLHTEIGLALRATGDNERMVRALGADPARLKLFGLALANGLVGLSGALVAQYQGFADVGLGLGTIVTGLASVIIGETLARPGSVGLALLAVVLGSVCYRLVIAAALLIGLGPSDMRLVTAAIVVAALGLPRLGLRLSRRLPGPA